MRRAARPEAGRRCLQLGGMHGSPVKRITAVKTTEFNRLPGKSWPCKQQGTERAFAQTGQPTAESAARRQGQQGMREDDGNAITFQQNLAHFERAARLFKQRGFILERLSHPERQQAHAKMLHCTLTTGGQGTRFDQPGTQASVGEYGRQSAPPDQATTHRGVGALSRPPMRWPGLTPRWANQPRFISRAKRAGRRAQWLSSVCGCMSSMLMTVPS